MLRMVNLLTPGLNLEFSGSKAIILTLTPEAKVSHARNKQKKRRRKKQERRGMEEGEKGGGGWKGREDRGGGRE